MIKIIKPNICIKNIGAHLIRIHQWKSMIQLRIIHVYPMLLGLPYHIYSIALSESVIIICFQNPFGPCPYVQVSNVCKYCNHSLYYYNKRKKGRRNDIVEIEEEKLQTWLVLRIAAASYRLERLAVKRNLLLGFFTTPHNFLHFCNASSDECFAVTSKSPLINLSILLFLSFFPQCKQTTLI